MVKVGRVVEFPYVIRSANFEGLPLHPLYIFMQLCTHQRLLSPSLCISLKALCSFPEKLCSVLNWLIMLRSHIPRSSFQLMRDGQGSNIPQLLCYLVRHLCDVFCQSSQRTVALQEDSQRTLVLLAW